MAKGRSKQKAGKFRLPSLTHTQAVVALIGSIFAVLAAAISIFTPIFKSSAPEFHLIKGASYHPDSTMIVQAMNSAAKKDKPLIFVIDEYQAAMVPKDQEGFVWRINLLQIRLPADVQRDKPHHVRFGFEQSKMSQQYKIYFDSKPPATYVGYESQSPTEKRIFGQVIDDNPDQNISVQVAFQHEEKLQKSMLPVKSFTDSSGRKMYEFEYEVQNIPQLSKNDPNYNQPFFAIKVTDEAGNEFHHTSTYNSFIAEGVQTFGTKAAEILFQKIDDEKVSVLAAKNKSLEQAKPTRLIAAGPPLITLRVLIRTPNLVVLNWNRLPENLHVAPEQYVMIRQNQELGTSFDTTYTDRSIVADSSYNYQVLARGQDDKYYPSNIATAEKESPPPQPLRSIPASLTADQVKIMVKNKKFFDRVLNETGTGYENQFEARTVKGDKVVIDHQSGLMWQQGGSENYMPFKDAKQWIDALNQKSYAGFTDWRLPTLEEAMSLMEPRKNQNNLYIDPIFDPKQEWIWTCDPVSGAAGAQWVVNFTIGACGSGHLNSYGSYVRAVRFGQSSP